jgi:plastocyanin
LDKGSIGSICIFFFVVNFGNNIPVVAGMAVGISFVLMFAVLSETSSPYYTNTNGKQPQVSIVRILSVLQTAPNSGFDPKAITVKIGVNNTVRWINEDEAAHGIPAPADDAGDPAFEAAVQKAKEEMSGILLPNGTFQYTFTKPGRFDLHMAPHPWMQDTVVVLPAFP